MPTPHVVRRIAGAALLVAGLAALLLRLAPSGSAVTSSALGGDLPPAPAVVASQDVASQEDVR